MTNQNTIRYKPVVLMIIDGWGISASWGGNALAMNNPTYLNSLWRQYPHAILDISDQENKNIGDSESGHASLGAGRIIPDNCSEIDKIIASGQFYTNPILKKACLKVNQQNGVLHIVGMLSMGGLHGRMNHILAMVELAKKEHLNNVAIHLIIDGIDDPPQSAIEYFFRFESALKQIGAGQVVSLIGRHYGLDRDKHWDLTSHAYRLQAFGIGTKIQNGHDALRIAYEKGYEDSIMPPFVLESNHPLLPIKKGDGVIMMNFRADGIHQLALQYLQHGLTDKWQWQKIPSTQADIVTLVDYHLPKNDHLSMAFPTHLIADNLSGILSKNHLRQLHIAESIKEEHVTFYFDGGRTEALPYEDRIIIPSINDRDYAKQPEMSLDHIAKIAIKAINKKRYDFIILNIANLDAIAHTNNFTALNRAVVKVDQVVKKITEAVLSAQGATIITSDHGCAEQMVGIASASHLHNHTNNPVPFIFISPDSQKDLIQSSIKPSNALLTEILTTKMTIADVAPSILGLFNLQKPNIMTGSNLIGRI